MPEKEKKSGSPPFNSFSDSAIDGPTYALVVVAVISGRESHAAQNFTGLG